LELAFHPERSRPQVKFLINQTECPVSNPPPMTMIINIPERALLINVARMSDLVGHQRAQAAAAPGPERELIRVHPRPGYPGTCAEP
jgi:hypothetical protein